MDLGDSGVLLRRRPRRNVSGDRARRAAVSPLRCCARAMWVAAIASVLSPVLLILDLGRPRLFINMLRIFKPQSAMSMGAWILAGFGMCVVPGLIALELHTFQLFRWRN